MVVYDKSTGEALVCESVDARELIASGQYTKEQAKPKAEIKRETKKSSKK